MMNVDYKVKGKKTREMLTKIDRFKAKMDNFCEKHPEYEYTVGELEKTENGYEMIINVKTNEK